MQAYEKEVRAREGAGMRHELNRMFDTLRDGEAGSSGTSATPAAATTPEPKGRVVLKAKRGAAKVKPATKSPKAARPSPVAKRLRFEGDDSEPASKRSTNYYLRSRRATDFKRKRTSMVARRALKNALKVSIISHDQMETSCISQHHFK